MHSEAVYNISSGIRTSTSQTYPLSRSTVKRIFRFYLGYEPKVTSDADMLILDAVEYFLDTLIRETEKACRDDGRMLITINHLQMALRNMGSTTLSNEVEKIKNDKRIETPSSRSQQKRIVVSLNANSLLSSHSTNIKDGVSSSLDKNSDVSSRTLTSDNITLTNNTNSNVLSNSYKTMTMSKDEHSQIPPSKKDPSSESNEINSSYTEQKTESRQAVNDNNNTDEFQEQQLDDIQAFESLMNGLL